MISKDPSLRLLLFYRTGNPHFPNIRSYNATLHFYNSTCLDGYIKVHHCHVIEFELKFNVSAYITTCGLLHHVKQYLKHRWQMKQTQCQLFINLLCMGDWWGSFTPCQTISKTQTQWIRSENPSRWDYICSNKIFTGTSLLIFCAWGSLTGGRWESGRVRYREERHGRRVWLRYRGGGACSLFLFIQNLFSKWPSQL